jgi:hypothetical protein
MSIFIAIQVDRNKLTKGSFSVTKMVLFIRLEMKNRKQGDILMTTLEIKRQFCPENVESFP